VLWRRDPSGEIEVAVVHRPRYDDWTLPKGKRDGGETDLETALREVKEETGLDAAPGAVVGSARYNSADGPKVVTYFALEAAAGEFVANDEVDDLRWLGRAAARLLLTYQRDREILDRLSV
jgi:8-oxo-dGTP diphosphatase